MVGVWYEIFCVDIVESVYVLMKLMGLFKVMEFVFVGKCYDWV